MVYSYVYISNLPGALWYIFRQNEIWTKYTLRFFAEKYTLCFSFYFAQTHYERNQSVDTKQ